MVKNFAARKLWKRPEVEKSKTVFPTSLGNPANTAGFPLSQQLRLLLSTRRTVVQQMGTFLSSYDIELCRI